MNLSEKSQQRIPITPPLHNQSPASQPSTKQLTQEERRFEYLREKRAGGVVGSSVPTSPPTVTPAPAPLPVHEDGDHGMRLVFVTPEQAKVWLETANVSNRRLSEDTWFKYACEMEQGNWLINGSTLVFDTNGKLIDGQHRLKAAVYAEVGFWTYVVTGVDPNVWDTVDGGRKRTPADALTKAKVQNGKAIAAAARLLFAFEKGGSNGASQALSNNFHFIPARHQEYLFTLERLEELQCAGKATGCVRRMFPPSLSAFCYCVFARQNKTLADRFFEELATGENLSSDNPAYLLRERMLSNQSNKSKLPVKIILALLFRAWISYRSGLPMKTLRWRTDGPKPEDFPQIELGVAGK